MIQSGNSGKGNTALTEELSATERWASFVLSREETILG
jgi:hypothetical protein